MFKDKAETFKDDIKILKEHIYIKRRQVNAYHDIKDSFSENNLCFMQTLLKVKKMASKMQYKVHISRINVSGYLQRVAMLEVLIIMMLETVILSF